MRPRKYYVVYTFGQSAKVVQGLALARAYEGRVPFNSEASALASARRWNAQREVERVLAEEAHAWRAYERATSFSYHTTGQTRV